MKFRILTGTPELNEEVQKKLFTLGYSWSGKTKEIKFPNAVALHFQHPIRTELPYTEGLSYSSRASFSDEEVEVPIEILDDLLSGKEIDIKKPTKIIKKAGYRFTKNI